MSSSSSLKKEIDKYQNNSSRSEGSDESSVAHPIAIPQTSIIRLRFLAFPWRNFRNYNVGWLLDLVLACPDSHPTLLKTRKRTRKTSFIVVPQR